jgi:hypothetical protein
MRCFEREMEDGRRVRALDRRKSRGIYAVKWEDEEIDAG